MPDSKEALKKRINDIDEKIKNIGTEALTKEQYDRLIKMLSKEFGEIKDRLDKVEGRLGLIEEHMSLQPSSSSD